MLTPDDIAQFTKAIGALDLSIREATVAMREHTAALVASTAAGGKAPASTSAPAPRSPSSAPPARTFTGDWRTFLIPFGRQEGQALGSIPGGSLRWWIENYQPKEFNGRPPRDSDLALRAALDAAKADGAGEKKAPAPQRENDLPLEKQNNLVNRDGSPAADEDVPF